MMMGPHERMAMLKGKLAKKHGKPMQGKVSNNIAMLTREAKAGTGPHYGKTGPKVPANRKDVIAAIAYSKARRGSS